MPDGTGQPGSAETHVNVIDLVFSFSFFFLSFWL